MFDDEKQPGDELEEIAREDQAPGERRPDAPPRRRRMSLAGWAPLSTRRSKKNNHFEV